MINTDLKNHPHNTLEINLAIDEFVVEIKGIAHILID